MAIDLEHALNLYGTWWSDLQVARESMLRLHSRRCVAWSDRSIVHKVAARALKPVAKARRPAPMLAQVDDEVCEQLYMLIRLRRPEVLVEISPFHGWSTAWMLTALQHNGAGFLRSFDLLDSASRNIPAELRANRWQLVVGDVRKSLGRIPNRIDFLLMDSDHSAEFARWYIDNVFPRVRPGAPVCVDDVFHSADPGSFDGEGPVLMEWLDRHRVQWFTCAKARNPSALNAIHGKKTTLGLVPRIRAGEGNTSVFFEMPLL
jgi:predicted O-methyltransferase YrrM